MSLVVVLASPVAADAQTLQGLVLDDRDDRPIATALVRLIDEGGEPRALTTADTTGYFRIVVPEPGVYRLVAERLGYEAFETPLLDVADPDGTYPLDLLMRRAPVPIRGLEVSTERADRRIRLMIGRNPSSLRVAPIHYEQIQAHVVRAHDLTDMMRWTNVAGLTVYDPPDGPCYQARGRGCLTVYMNGFPIVPELIPVIPLDMLETVVIVFPNESIIYPSGGVLLYTEAWLR